MANNGTGVEIPVIIDIDQACRDAAARVKKAMEPLERQISDNALELHFKFESTKTSDIYRTLDNIKKAGNFSLKELERALKNVNNALQILSNQGKTTTERFKALLEAKYYLQDMVSAAKIAGLEIEGMANTMNGLNAQLKASRIALNESALGSPEWNQAAQNIHRITEEMAKWQTQLQNMGHKAGSINELQAELAELERKWNALSMGNRRWNEDLTSQIKKRYREITAELEKEGRTLSQIIAEEQKRNNLARQGAQNRRFEEWSLKNLATTMAGLRKQAQTLQHIMDTTIPHSERWQMAAAQLKVVNAEINRLEGGHRRVKSSIDATNASMEKQSALWQQLKGLAGMYLGVFGGMRLLRNIRETTSQFELQRVALGAVIQDTQKAEGLFKQLKQAALESPFEIKDLVTYTKQLAAYQIETEKLFDTTKRLADVSAGLGVDMGRLILAYGQVRAASVLRGQELRQFTEAGVPLVNKLAEKFSQLRGEMVTTGEVFELISKRAVPFSMISEIFEDMTEKGGIFYDMQKKQSETLYGQWQKLKDAASIMYDEIGNTDVMQAGMRGLMDVLMNLMRNWERVGRAIEFAAAAWFALKGLMAFLPIQTRNTLLYQKALKSAARARQLLSLAEQNGSRATMLAAKQQILITKYLRLATTATTGLSRAWYRLMASMASGGWIGIAITGLVALIGYLSTANNASDKLAKSLSKIGTEAALKSEQSVRNFQRLAATATDTTKSVDEQAAAVKELQRTFGDIIPSEKLQIDYLQSLKGNYDDLTQAIRENIQMEAKRQKLDEIKDTYAAQINRKQRQIKDVLKDTYGFSDEEVEAAFIVLQKAVDKGAYNLNASLEERASQLKGVLEEVFTDKKFPELIETMFSDMGESYKEAKPLLNLVQGLALRYKGLQDATKAVEGSQADLIATTGKYADAINTMQQKLAESESKLMQQELFAKRAKENIDELKNSFDFQQAIIQSKLAIIKETIQDFLGEDVAIDWNKIFIGDFVDFKELSKHFIGLKSQTVNAVKEVQKEYEKLKPTDALTFGMQERFYQIAESVSAPLDDLKNYLKKSDENIEDYVKRLGDGIKTYQDVINKWNYQTTRLAAGQLVFQNVSEETKIKAEKMIEALTKMEEELSAWMKKPKGGAGTTAYVKPKFITDIEESMKFMKDFKKGYDELSKHLTRESALDRESNIMKNRGLVLGMNVEEQKEAATDLLGWYQKQIDKTIAEMKKAGARGNTMEELLGLDVGKNKKLKDFQQLLLSLADAMTDLQNADLDKKLEKALSDLADKVKRSEAAKKFYEGIFDLTGDKEMAMSMSLAVYGDTGKGLEENIRKQLETAFVLDSDKISKAGESYDKIAKAVKEAIASGNYGELDKYLDFVVDKNKSTATAVVQNWQKRNEELLKNYAQTIEKFSSLERKRVLVAAKSQKEIDDIRKSADLQMSQQGLSKELIDQINKQGLSQELLDKIATIGVPVEAIQQIIKERDDIIKALKAQAELDLKKLSDEYIAFFAELNVLTAKQAASTRVDLREAYLKAFADGAISAAELRRNLKAIDDQFKKLQRNTTIFTEYLSSGMDGAIQKLQDYADTIQIISKKIESGQSLSAEETSFADRMIRTFGKKFGGQDMEGISSLGDLFSKMGKNSDGMSKAGQAFGQMGKGMSQMAAKGGSALAIVDAIIQAVNQTIVAIQSVIDELNKMRSADNQIGKSFKYLSDFNKYAYGGWEKLKSGDVMGAAADTINSWVSVFNNIQENKVRKFNKRIKEQESLLSELEYEYNRLDAAIDKAFGESYIYNYNKQLENLVAQQQAYLKQAELERSKGKSKDKDKIKEYEDKARETADAIADMQSQLSEFFTGTDLTSAAEDFATAWIDAYKEFANTTDAMSDKFNDMIESMITRSLAAKIMQTILQPLFDQIDQMARDGDLSTTEIAEIARLAPEYVTKMNEAMTAMASDLSAAGYNLRGNAAKLTGISRDIASASEESILGLSAAINTQNFYISRIPSIDEKMSQIIALMGGGTAQGGTATGEAPEVDLKLQYLSYLPSMASDVNEILLNLKRVISPMGANTATHYIAMR